LHAANKNEEKDKNLTFRVATVKGSLFDEDGELGVCEASYYCEDGAAWGGDVSAFSLTSPTSGCYDWYRMTEAFCLWF